VNQDWLSGYRSRSFFEAGDKGVRTFDVVGMCSVKNNIEFRRNISEVGRIKICDNNFYTRLRFEVFSASRIADNCSDVIVLFESEEVVEELPANESGGTYCQSRTTDSEHR
jgi:hypothetical protein